MHSTYDILQEYKWGRKVNLPVGLSYYVVRVERLKLEIILKQLQNQSIIPQGCHILLFSLGISGVSINCWNRIEIEDNVIIGAGSAIWDTDFHPTDPVERFNHPRNGKTAPIIIKKNNFIGARVLILKGVTIGENCIIAAGTVINKNVPSNSIVFGNPMKIKEKK